MVRHKTYSLDRGAMKIDRDIAPYVAMGKQIREKQYQRLINRGWPRTLARLAADFIAGWMGNRRRRALIKLQKTDKWLPIDGQSEGSDLLK